MKITGIFILFVAFSCTQAKVYKTCELAQALLNKGFSKDQLNDWVCLIESESSRNTKVVGGPNSDGSYDYGLFQINSRYWCKKGSPGHSCNIKCEDLLTDNITDEEAKCVHKIYGESGFNAWFGWQKQCKNKNIPNIVKQCNL